MVSIRRYWKQLAIVIAVAGIAGSAFAMTDNGDGTRTFTVGESGDFVSLETIVFGVPAGAMANDTVEPYGVVYFYRGDYSFDSPPDETVISGGVTMSGAQVK